MDARKYVSALFLSAALAGSALAFTPQDEQSPKQDMKDAGHETKNAAKDTGRATKKTTKKTGHAMKHTNEESCEQDCGQDAGRRAESKRQDGPESIAE